MWFLLFAIAAVAWCLAVVRWVVGRRALRAPLLLSAIALILGALSVAADFRALRPGPRADVGIRIEDVDGWWRLTYSRGGATVVAANELHVPAGESVTVTWSGQRPPLWIAGMDCLAPVRSTYVIDGRSRVVHLVRLWPPMWRRLPVVEERRFDDWLAHQQAPAERDDFLFVNAGCAYCHVIRGVAEEASVRAPDLTHFGSRSTIASAALPNKPAVVAGWIADPRHLKRHTVMPPNPLEPAVLHRIAGYLESLR